MVLNLVGLVLSLLGVGISLWQIMRANQKRKLELESIKQENAGMLFKYAVWTFLLGSLAVFIAVMLARKAA